MKDLLIRSYWTILVLLNLLVSLQVFLGSSFYLDLSGEWKLAWCDSETSTKGWWWLLSWACFAFLEIVPIVLRQIRLVKLQTLASFVFFWLFAYKAQGDEYFSTGDAIIIITIASVGMATLLNAKQGQSKYMSIST